MAARKKAGKGKKTSRSRKSSVSRTTVTGDGNAPAFPEIEALVELMDRHGLFELEYLSSPDGTREVRISRVSSGGGNPEGAPSPAAKTDSPPAEVLPAAPPEERFHAIESPMVGTFFRAPSPEAPPFVSVGDTVDENSTLCIIEAMKVMNEINPDVRGEIVSIEVENGEAVEFGQTLFLVRPA